MSCGCRVSRGIITVFFRQLYSVNKQSSSSRLRRHFESAKDSDHETHFSAQPSQARPPSRLSCPDGNSFRSCHHRGPSSPRSQATDGLISGRFERAASILDSVAALAGPMPAMSKAARFPRSARLLRPAEFRRVFSCRSSRQNRLFRIHFALPSAALPRSAHSRVSEGLESESARMGLAIAKRAVRHAHDRNRIKRLARETFRQRRDQIRPGDYIVTANRAAADACPTELRAALDHLWQSLELK